MPAYVVAVTEETVSVEALKTYRRMALGPYERFKPHVIASRASRHATLEGPPAESISILEFDTYEAAEAWYRSADYQAAAEHRRKGARVRFILVDGVKPRPERPAA